MVNLNIFEYCCHEIRNNLLRPYINDIKTKLISVANAEKAEVSFISVQCNDDVMMYYALIHIACDMRMAKDLRYKDLARCM